MVNVWQISPWRERYDLWQEFRDAGIIAIGWEMGDLLQYEDDVDLQKKTGRGLNDVGSCWTFSHKIEKDDIVVAKKGSSTQIYGIGRVLEKYRYDDTRPYYKHIIRVDWRIKFEKLLKLNVSKEFVQTTVGKLDIGIRQYFHFSSFIGIFRSVQKVFLSHHHTIEGQTKRSKEE
jgi:hypothetical protein